jgi:hypothetical protein
VHLFRSLFFQYTLQGKIEGLACHLSAEHHEDFDFAGRPDQGCVHNAEPLGDERQPSAEVGKRIVWILERSANPEERRG